MSGRQDDLGLDERLAAFEEAVAIADGRVPPDLLSEARRVLRRTGERRARGEGAVVVALCGGTGTGKSSLFNLLTGRELAGVDVRRPTTDAASAWAVGDADELLPLLEWLEVEPGRRHLVGPDAGPHGLVLLDLPDMDSVVDANRRAADRLVERVDVLVWVVDPQKYAQRSLHESHLARLREHAAVTLVVLNQVDLLDRDQRRTVRDDLEQLIGFSGGPPVLETSALTGEGVDELRDLITREVVERRAVSARIAADVRVAAGDLLCELEPPRQGRPPTHGVDTDRHELVGLDPEALSRQLTRLADVDAFAEQARAVYVTTARGATRSPLLRLVGVLGALLGSLFAGIALLGRLTVVPRGRSPSGVAAVSEPTQLDVRHALRGLSHEARRQLPWFWAERVETATRRAASTLPGTLTSALAAITLKPSRRRWWPVLLAVWTISELAIVAGVVWIVLLPLLVLWLQLPPVPTLTIGDGISLPGVLLAAGVVVWIVVAVVRRLAVPVGARRHEDSVARRARESVHRAVDETALAPLRGELEAFSATWERLSLAGS